MKYIGARYMPKFMGAHDLTTEYEALSVVDNGMGTSYVSNKTVPAGTPLTDTKYWAVYGSTNGAILDLQNRVSNLEAFDAKIENSTFIQTDKSSAVFFGDSLTVGDIGGVATDRPYPLVYGEIAGIEVTNKAYAGSSAANHGSPHYLADAVTEVNFADFDQMFICHGVNDFSGNSVLGTIDSTDPTTFYGAYNYAIQRAYSQNKSIEIILLTTFYATTTTAENSTPMQSIYNAENHTIYDYIEAVRNIAGRYNLRCVDMQEALGVNKYDYQSYLIDNVHMNAAGYEMVGRYLAKQLSFPKTPTIVNFRQYNKQRLSHNMINIVDFEQNAVGGFTKHVDYKNGMTIALTIGDIETALSQQRYNMKAGVPYSLHFNVALDAGMTVIVDLTTAGGDTVRPCFYTNNSNVQGEYPIDVVFVVPVDGTYRMGIGIYDGGSIGSGNLRISDLVMNEGMIPNYHELGSNFLNNTFWKEGTLGTNCTSNSSNPFKYYMDDAGTVHLQGQIDRSIAPSSAYNDLLAIPAYFMPNTDCDFVAATTDGHVVFVHLNKTVGVISIKQNSDITGAFTVDLTGISWSAIKQNALATAPLYTP